MDRAESKVPTQGQPRHISRLTDPDSDETAGRGVAHSGPGPRARSRHPNSAAGRGLGWSRGGRRDIWVRVGAVNLFDERYTEPFSRLPAYGRSFIASLSFEF